MQINKILLMTLFFLYGLLAWADNLPSKPGEKILNGAVKSSTDATVPTTSDLNKSSSTVTVHNPEKGINNPIAITINMPPPAPALPVLPPQQTTVSNNPTPETKPTIYSSNKIEVPPTPSLDIVINKKYRNSPKVKKLYRMLGIRNNPSIIHLVTNRNVAEANDRDDIIAIQPRSFISMLHFLSNSVEVVPEMIKQGLVVVPKYPDGKYFNLQNMTKGLFVVHISPTIPKGNVSVQVYYRNHWFYIADNDYKTKRTFSMIQQIFNLQAGESQGQNVPVLTIPTR